MSATGSDKPSPSLALRFAPLLVFVGIAAIGIVGLFVLGDRHALPSALLNQPFPEFEAPLLHEPDKRVSRADIIGEPMLVNVWATWCPTCIAEHGELQRITQNYGVPIIGVNYKDDIDAARRFLASRGDPFALNLVDADGQIGVDLGVYGAPETFLVDADGTIVYKRIGDVNPRIWRDELRPALEAIGYAFP